MELLTMSNLTQEQMNDLEKLQSLKDGEECVINWHEEGGGMVTRAGDAYLLEYVPQYGGAPVTHGIYTQFEFMKMIEIANSWT